MRVYDLLRVKGSDVVTVHPSTSVTDVLALMKRHNLGSVVVSSSGRDIAGIMTERDVVRRLVDGTDFLTGDVSEAMSVEVETCQSNDSVQSLMSTMTNRRIRHLPVVDDHGGLIGIISIGDVVKSHIDELEFERDQLHGYLSR